MLRMQSGDEVDGDLLLVHGVELLQAKPVLARERHFVDDLDVLGKSRAGLLRDHAAHLVVRNFAHFSPLFRVPVPFDLQTLQALKNRVFVDVGDVGLDTPVGRRREVCRLNALGRNQLVFGELEIVPARRRIPHNHIDRVRLFAFNSDITGRVHGQPLPVAIEDRDRTTAVASSGGIALASLQEYRPPRAAPIYCCRRTCRDGDRPPFGIGIT
jgi:hypothetical protein